MRYLDICSGISAPTMAWRELGWQCAGYSEIEKFPRAVLAERYGAQPVDWDHRHVPGSNVTPLFGDFTRIEAHHVGPIDLLVGGTPCQDFSVAGLRAGLDGDRGNLSLEYLRLADRTRPRWLVWENVPGVLSIDGGRAFGAILGGMGELGYGFAYRVFDAQYAGVPQRRRRVFVVGHLGDWRSAAAVLFERHSLSRNTPPRREAGEDVAPTISARTRGGGGLGTDFDCDGGLIPSTGDTSHCLNAGGMGRQDYETDTLIAHSLTPVCYDTTHITSPGNWSNQKPGDPCHPVTATAHVPLLTQPVAFQSSQSGVRCDTVHATLDSNNGSRRHNGVVQDWAVRRLTPTECERLQGFPDGHTAVTYRGKPAADGPRYKALGNSMAVPDVRWIGERIAMVDAMPAILAARAA